MQRPWLWLRHAGVDDATAGHVDIRLACPLDDRIVAHDVKAKHHQHQGPRSHRIPRLAPPSSQTTPPCASHTRPPDPITQVVSMRSTLKVSPARCLTHCLPARCLDAVDHGVQLSNNAPRVADAPATLEHHCRLAAREEFSYRRARVVGFAEDDIAGIWPPVRDQQSEIMSAVFIHLTGIGLTPCNAQRVACDLERRLRP